jgi:hypothetical protein
VKSYDRIPRVLQGENGRGVVPEGSVLVLPEETMPRGHRLAFPILAHPRRVAGYPKYTNDSFPLLVIFDDSLHNRWSHQNLQFVSGGLSWSPVPFEQDDTVDVGRLRGGQRVPCGKSIRATFRQSASMLTLKASAAMVVANATVPLQLSLAFTLASTGPPCDSTPTRGWCNSTACVSLRRHGTVLADTVFVPLCGTRQQGPKVSTVFLPNEELGHRWQQMEVPIELFDGPYARRRSQLDELVVVPRGEMLEMDAGGGELEGGEGGEPGRRRRRQQRRARHVAQGLLPLEPPLVVYLDEVRLSA